MSPHTALPPFAALERAQSLPPAALRRWDLTWLLAGLGCTGIGYLADGAYAAWVRSDAAQQSRARMVGG